MGFSAVVAANPTGLKEGGRSTWWVWPGLTVAMAALLGAVAWWLEDVGAGGLRVGEAAGWISAGVATSLATRIFCWGTVWLPRVGDQPIVRIMAESFVRMAIPLSVLLAIAIVRRDLLQAEALLYFLPFQFITMVAAVVESLSRAHR